MLGLAHKKRGGQETENTHFVGLIYQRSLVGQAEACRLSLSDDRVFES